MRNFPFPKSFKTWVEWGERLIQVLDQREEVGFGSPALTLKSAGNFGTWLFPNTTRKSLGSFIIGAGAFDPNSTLEIWVGARIDAVPVGTWQVEVEFGGTIVAKWIVLTPIISMYHGRFIHNLNSLTSQRFADIFTQVDTDSTNDAGTASEDTEQDVLIEIFAKVNNAGDVGKTVNVYGLLVVLHEGST